MLYMIYDTSGKKLTPKKIENYVHVIVGENLSKKILYSFNDLLLETQSCSRLVPTKNN